MCVKSRHPFSRPLIIFAGVLAILLLSSIWLIRIPGFSPQALALDVRNSTGL